MKGKALRIAFVSLHSPEDSDVLPLGAGCAAASLVGAKLVSHEDISLVDACVADDEALLFRCIVETNPCLVGFSLYCWNSKVSLSLAARLRAAFPEITIIAGGPDAEWLAAMAADSGASFRLPFDAIFLGEVEASLPAWYADWASRAANSPGGITRGTDSRTDPVIVREGPCDAAALASPWLEGILKPKRGGSVAWELTRGCPFRCTYCYEGRGFSGLRHFPSERLASELELFVAMGVREVFVLDPTFNVQGERALCLLKLFAEKGGNIHWYFEIRAELLDRAQARAFSQIPCSLQIGLQSSQAEVLKNIGRDMDRKRFVSKIGLLNDAGAVFGLDLIYGLPGDSLQGFRESLDFALSLSPNHLDIFPLAVLPGTVLYRQRAEFGLECDEEPPYILHSQPRFSAADMDAAAVLALACRLFYSEGRAVPWFLAVLKPLRLAPSAFLAGFDAWREEKSREGKSRVSRDFPSRSHQDIEKLQCAYISKMYEAKGKRALLPAALDLVHYYGAWSRAFAESASTKLELSYSLDVIESSEILNIEYFCKHEDQRPCLAEVYPAKHGPAARILKRYA